MVGGNNSSPEADPLTAKREKDRLRKQAERDRRKEALQNRTEVWVPPGHKVLVVPEEEDPAEHLTPAIDPDQVAALQAGLDRRGKKLLEEVAAFLRRAPRAGIDRLQTRIELTIDTYPALRS